MTLITFYAVPGVSKGIVIKLLNVNVAILWLLLLCVALLWIYSARLYSGVLQWKINSVCVLLDHVSCGSPVLHSISSLSPPCPFSSKQNAELTRASHLSRCFEGCFITKLSNTQCMNSMKLVIPLHFISFKKVSKRCCDATTPESVHTIDESKRGSAFAFIFGVNWPIQWM